MEHLENFKNYITKGNITSHVLDIISDLNSTYFNTKKIRHGLYKRYGISLRGRPCSYNDISNDLHLKMITASRIGHIIRKLKNNGYIEKFNRRTWKRVKEINIDDPSLQVNES